MTKRSKWLIVSVLSVGLLLAFPAPARADAIVSVADCGSRGDILGVRLSGNGGSGPYAVEAGRGFTVTTEFVPSRDLHDARLAVTAETSFGEIRLARAVLGPVTAGVPATVGYTARLYPTPRGDSVNLRTEVTGAAGGPAEVCTGVEVSVVDRD